MTDKIQKIRKEVEKIAKSINPFIPDEDGKNSDYEAGKLDAATQILQIIDSLEEPVRRTSTDIESVMQEVEEKSKAFTEAHKGESSNEILAEIRGEEPVSEELEDAAVNYAEQFMKEADNVVSEQAKWRNRHPEEPVVHGGIKACFLFQRDAFKAGAQWQKVRDEDEIRMIRELLDNFDKTCDEYHDAGFKHGQEALMKGAIEVTVHIDAGNYPYIPEMELYDYDKDVPLAKEGDKYKVVLIKEE